MLSFSETLTYVILVPSADMVVTENIHTKTAFCAGPAALVDAIVAELKVLNECNVNGQ